MVMTPRLFIPERGGVNGGDNQATAMRLGPAPVSTRFGAGNDESLVKLNIPVKAGAGPLATISTPKASVSTLLPAFKFNVTGMLTALPGAPDPPPAETVPCPCATKEAGQSNKTRKTTLNLHKAISQTRYFGGLLGRRGRSNPVGSTLLSNACEHRQRRRAFPVMLPDRLSAVPGKRALRG